MPSSDPERSVSTTDIAPPETPGDSPTGEWAEISTYDASPPAPVEPGASTDPLAATDPAASPASNPSDARYIQHYELIRELGRGGMGVVHLARDLRLGRLVAIKMLTKPGHHQERFLAEARATARCRHENIVVIHDVGIHGEQPYLVFEYLRGQTLRQWMEARPGGALDLQDSSGSSGQIPAPLAPTRAVEMIMPVVRALVCAHDMGIIHRDLKPANILLTEDGITKVLDFGVAKIGAVREDLAVEDAADAGAPLALTALGARLGTLPYMSPEQLAGEAVDHRSDIWAVGIILYELLTGAHPLAPLSMAKIHLIAELDTPMPGVREHRSDLGPLADIISRCLLKEREHRTATVRELLQELEALLPVQRTRARDDSSNPFAGLASFQESDADRFFGRDHEVTSLIGKLRSMPIVAVTGPSGAGKSSLVRAGVIPALKRSGEGWEAIVIRSGRQPLAALADVLLAMSVRSSEMPTGRGITRGAGQAPEERDAVIARLRTEPGYLGITLRTWSRAKLRRMLIFVDQFEELWTLGIPSDERAAFLACLAAAADDVASPLRVIIAMRSDFLDRLAEERALSAEITRGIVLLPPMEREGLRESLLRPVDACEFRFESTTLVDRMVDTFDTTPGALPLLQFTAARLWELRDTKRRLLTEASYQRLGGVGGALARHAEDTLARMPAAHRPLVREIFRQLVTADGTRAILTRRELRQMLASSEADAVIEELIRARLLVASEGDADEARIEVVHEALLSSWPRLAAWQQEDAEGARMRDQLRTAARQWLERGRSRGLLWRGDAVLEYRVWHSRYRGSLTEAEEAFARASLHEEMRGRQLKRIALAAAFIVLAVGLVLLLVMNRRIIRERDRATVAGVTTQQVLGFLVDLFKVSDPYASSDRDISARKILDRGKDKIGQLAGQPEVQATLMHVMGVVYGNLGLYQDSAVLLQDALAKRRQLHDSEQLEVADSLHALAKTLEGQQVFGPAERAAREALDLRRTLLGTEHLDTAETMEVLADVLIGLSRRGEAESLYQKVLGIRRQLLGAEHAMIAQTLARLGLLHTLSEDHAQATQWYQQALDMYRGLSGNHTRDIAVLQYRTGLAHTRRDELAAAEPLLEESLATSKRLFGSAHPTVTSTMYELARLYLRTGKYEQAGPLFDEVLTSFRTSMGEKSMAVGLVLAEQSFLARLQGDCAKAEALSRESLDIYRRAVEGDHNVIVQGLGNRAYLLMSWGNPIAAEPLYRDLLDMYVRLYGVNHPMASVFLASLAEAHLAQGELIEAESLLARATEILQRQAPPRAWLLPYVESVRGVYLSKSGNLESAERLLLSAYESMRTSHGPHRYYTMAAAGRVIAFYQTQGQTEEANKRRSLPTLPRCTAVP